MSFLQRALGDFFAENQMKSTTKYEKQKSRNVH